MVRHGYITMAEADAANAIPIEELTKNGAGNSDDTDYQGFIDTVVSEIKQDTKAQHETRGTNHSIQYRLPDNSKGMEWGIHEFYAH